MKDNFYSDTEKNAQIKSRLDAHPVNNRDTIYAYAIMKKENPGYFTVINNHPEWFDVYIRNNYQFIDPVIIRAMNCVQDFHWDENIILPASHFLPRIFREAARHNVASGHTFVLHDPDNNLVLLSFMQHALQHAHSDVLQQRSGLLTFFIELHQMTMDMYAQEKYAHKKVLLSPREQQILYWAGKGKTYFEIAIMLSISERTVKFHIKNAVRKTGVINTRHAIQICTELNLLNSEY